jgi:hypothetical protein
VWQALLTVLIIAVIADVLSKAVDGWYMAVRESGELLPGWSLFHVKWTRVSPVLSAYVSGTIPMVALVMTYRYNPPRALAHALAWLLRRKSGKWHERLGWFAWACFISYAAWYLKGVRPGALMLLGDVGGSYAGARLGVPLLLALSGWYLRVRPGSRWVSQWRPSLQQTATQDALIGANVFGLAAARIMARLFEKVGIRGEQELEQALKAVFERLAELITPLLHTPD